MNLDKLIVPTAVAEPGMTVEALFRECIAKQVPGLPFRDKHGKLSRLRLFAPSFHVTRCLV